MSTPYQRTRALIQTSELLKRLLDPRETPRIPGWLRREAKGLLRHYPSYADIESAHKAVPDTFGPVPPFSRLTGTVDVQGIIEASDAKP